MKTSHLFSLLAAMVILAGILAAGLSLWQSPPPQPEPLPAVSQSSSGRQASPKSGKKESEPDLTTSYPLSRDEILPLYAALEKRIREYKTVHVRTRLVFHIMEDKRPVEAEFWFDAIRPDRYIHKTIKSMPKNRKSMSSPFVPLPYMTEIRDGSRMTVINYRKRSVYQVDLAAKDSAAKQLAATMLVKCATQQENPLQDLLFGISFENRLNEMVEAKLVSTSHGKETQVLFRVTGEMSQKIQNSQLAGNLPVSNEGLVTMALRRDVFDSSSGNLLQSIYLDPEWHPFLTQTYPEIEWDVDIPDDRFVSDAPPGSVTHNISERVTRLKKLAITQSDIAEFYSAGHPYSATSLLELQHLKEREKGLDPSH